MNCFLTEPTVSTQNTLTVQIKVDEVEHEISEVLKKLMYLNQFVLFESWQATEIIYELTLWKCDSKATTAITVVLGKTTR